MNEDREGSPEWVRRPAQPRKKRGTAGTFNGRRPPKDPVRLEEFEAERKKHEDQKRLKKTKSTPTPKQKAYWDSLSAKLSGPGSVGSKRAALGLASTTPQKSKRQDDDFTPIKVPEFKQADMISPIKVPELEGKQAAGAFMPDEVPELEVFKAEGGIECQAGGEHIKD